jgi:hypothetical protein
MITHNTHWSKPKRNILAGLNDLRFALASGMNAQLIRLANEDCTYPIEVKNSVTDFRAYEQAVGLLKTRQQIIDDDIIPKFEKQLTLNYKTCYGTKAAMDHYYETGLLSSDNFRGMGCSHLVLIKDLVRFHLNLPDKKLREYGRMFDSQYFGKDTGNQKHFYDHYRLKQEHSIYTIKRFRRKLWVVEIIKDNQPKTRTPVLVHVMNALAYPLKFIPKRRVLKMGNYKCVSYRIGDVTHGFSLEFHIPKKFSF